MDWLKIYGDTEGPLGFPMKDADAKALDKFLQENPEAEYQRLVVEKATSELATGERADVSWIQTEAVDRQGEVILAAGFRDDQFKANPIVTLNHDYSKQPIGKSMWRRRVREGDRRGVKAKTVYPAKPEEWKADVWPSDAAWALVKSGLLTGKSIGFLTIKSHSPTEQEVKKRADLANVRRIVDEWMLVEYCACWLPINPEATVDMIAKAQIDPESLRFVGQEVPKIEPKGTPPEEIIPHTPLTEIENRIAAQFKSIDTAELVQRLWKEGYDRARGRI